MAPKYTALERLSCKLIQSRIDDLEQETRLQLTKAQQSDSPPDVRYWGVILQVLDQKNELIAALQRENDKLNEVWDIFKSEQEADYLVDLAKSAPISTMIH